MQDNNKVGPEALIPNWVEFLKITDRKQGNAAAVKFFGEESATEEDFDRQFNVNLTHYRNMYLEIGLADAPVGNIYGAKITILVIQQSETDGKFTPQLIKHNGLVNPERGQAWIKMNEWEEVVQDNLKEELLVEAQKEIERHERVKEQMENIVNEELPDATTDEKQETT